MTNPYRGLVPFTEEDAKTFAGRDEVVQQLYNNARANRITTVFGESGVGKTSVLWAGLLPRFTKAAARQRERGDAPEFHCVLFRDWPADPASQLLKQAAKAVGEKLPAPGQTFAESLAALNHKGHWVFILDQFEDVFDRVESKTRSEFLLEVHDALWRSDLQIHLLISIREDLLYFLDELKPTLPDVFSNLIQLRGLTESQTVEAIKKPLESASEGPQKVEDPEAIAIAKDMFQLRGASSTVRPADLQIILETWWETERDKGRPTMLLRTVREELGGVNNIAEKYFLNKLKDLDAKNQALAARLLPLLVSPGGRKQPQSLADFDSLPGVGAKAAEELLTRWVNSTRILSGVTLEGKTNRQRVGYQFAHDILADASRKWCTEFEAERRRVAERQDAEQLALGLKRDLGRRRLAMYRKIGILLGAGLLLFLAGWRAWEYSDAGKAERLLAQLSDSGLQSSEFLPDAIWQISSESNSVRRKVLDRALSSTPDARRFNAIANADPLLVAISGISPSHLRSLANDVVATRCSGAKPDEDRLDACVNSIIALGAWANPESSLSLANFCVHIADHTSRTRALAELSNILPLKRVQAILLKEILERQEDTAEATVRAFASRVKPGWLADQVDLLIRGKTGVGSLGILADYEGQTRVDVQAKMLFRLPIDSPPFGSTDPLGQVAPYVSRPVAEDLAKEIVRQCLSTPNNCRSEAFEALTKSKDKLSDAVAKQLAGDLLILLRSDENRKIGRDLLSALGPWIAGSDAAKRAIQIVEKSEGSDMFEVSDQFYLQFFREALSAPAKEPSKDTDVKALLDQLALKQSPKAQTQALNKLGELKNLQDAERQMIWDALTRKGGVDCGVPAVAVTKQKAPDVMNLLKRPDCSSRSELALAIQRSFKLNYHWKLSELSFPFLRVEETMAGGKWRDFLEWAEKRPEFDLVTPPTLPKP